MPIMPASGKRSSTKPKMVPLASAVSSSRNSVRLTRNKKGDMRIKFTGPVAKFAGFAAVFDLLPILFPEAGLYFAIGLGTAASLTILWLVWTVLVKGQRLDHNPDDNQFEAGRRATGFKWVAAKGAAAWVIAAGLTIGLFLFLYPLQRIAVGISFTATLVVCGGLMAWFYLRRERSLPIQ
jgi:hypothetical protein